MFERLFAFIARHPRGFDVVVALFWVLLSVADEEFWTTEGRAWLYIPFSAVTGIALYWRRSFPLHVFAFHSIVVLIMTVIDVDDPVPATVICATYSLAAHAPERRLSIAAFFAFVTAGLTTVLIIEPSVVPDTLVIALVLGISWVIGDSLRTRRAYRQSLLERAERAEALRDSLAQQAVAEERTRIARDLHDVVAHSMSLMVVQAGAARRVATTDPEASIAALEAIESVGRNSLDEMRRILGVLRGEEDAAAIAPQPDIAAIETLVDEFRTAGLPVTVTQGGTPRPLPASVELTAYRIVQESLTNTLKHAGPASATVVLDFEDDALRIEVEDNGRGHPPDDEAAAVPGPGGQKGHVGMRERVAAFGGFFNARPRLDGGYHVVASLPLADAATPASEGAS